MSATTEEPTMTATATRHAVYFQLIDHSDTVRVLRAVDSADTTALVNAVDDVAQDYAAQLQGGRDFADDLEHATLVAEFSARLLRFVVRLNVDPGCGASLRGVISDDEGQAEITYRVVCEAVTA